MEIRTGAAIAVLLSMLVCPMFLFSQELLEMPEPTHTEAGVPVGKLSIVKEIQSDFGEDLFFAIPWQISLGEKHWYVYDDKLVKIFVFTYDYFYVGQFLDQGRGPAEVFPGYTRNKAINAGPDGKLYVFDALGDKIIQFTAEGKHIKDIKMNRKMRSWNASPPIVDKNGNFYLHSVNEGIIDEFEPGMKLVHTFLNKELNGHFVIFRPAYKEYYKKRPDPLFWMKAKNSNTSFDLTSEGQLIVYLFNSSMIYQFEGKKQVRQYQILIDRTLPHFKKRAEKAILRQKDKRNSGVRAVRLFNHFFVDKDGPYFYLQYFEEDESVTLFKFTLTGRLVKVYKNLKSGVLVKRYGLFFGFKGGDRHPVILKEEELK